MARTELPWHDNFKAYMETIAAHPNYTGLPIARKRDGSLGWFAFAKGEMGQARKRWAEDIARQLNIPVRHGVYADVMLEIHPTKKHVCQICGSQMSLYYHYPNANFVKLLHKTFGLEFSSCDHINDVWDIIIESGVPEENVVRFFKARFELPAITPHDKDSIIKACEFSCRKGDKNDLGPGAMSNFPDRFVGFHFNRCCRASQDKGRSAENLKSYAKDRRAYEYWSDGNIHAADMFMGSHFFKGRSADHIGPISLGFVHDPRYLRPMPGSENSAKRDRLLVEDIETILTVEAATGVYPMSWYSAGIWEFIKRNYMSHQNIVATIYRDMLKQNMANFMYVLKILAGRTGINFLYKEFIEPKYEYFLHAYEFDELGNIIKETPRHFTERNRNEIERFSRIAFQSVNDYNDKENRHLSPNLTDAEKLDLLELCNAIELCEAKKTGYSACREMLINLIRSIEQRIIKKM